MLGLTFDFPDASVDGIVSMYSIDSATLHVMSALFVTAFHGII